MYMYNVWLAIFCRPTYLELWAINLDERRPICFFLIARHCDSYCFIVFQFISHFAQLANNKLT